MVESLKERRLWWQRSIISTQYLFRRNNNVFELLNVLFLRYHLFKSWKAPLPWRQRSLLYLKVKVWLQCPCVWFSPFHLGSHYKPVHLKLILGTRVPLVHNLCPVCDGVSNMVNSLMWVINNTWSSPFVASRCQSPRVLGFWERNCCLPSALFAGGECLCSQEERFHISALLGYVFNSGLFCNTLCTYHVCC